MLAAGSDLPAGATDGAVVDFMRCAEAEALTGTSVQLGGDAIAVSLGEVAEVGSLGRYCRISPLVFSLVPRSQAW